MEAKKKRIYYPLQFVLEEIYPDISKDSIVRLIERGEIPARRVTNKYFIPVWWVQAEIDFALHPPTKRVTQNIKTNKNEVNEEQCEATL